MIHHLWTKLQYECDLLFTQWPEFSWQMSFCLWCSDHGPLAACRGLCPPRYKCCIFGGGGGGAKNILNCKTYLNSNVFLWWESTPIRMILIHDIKWFNEQAWEWPDTKKSEKIQVPKTSPVTLRGAGRVWVICLSKSRISDDSRKTLMPERDYNLHCNMKSCVWLLPR